ncbi:ABC transporter permease [Pseudonocardia zijingensis]|uniref:ABC transporter permease n=1 Tax=Pseudonocardia zijingensis TaxID=153376 RepID=A0ABP4AIE5_9PSEU
MLLYALRRLGIGVVLAVLVTFITYLLLSTSFRDMVSTLLGPDATPDSVTGRLHDLGYDRPLVVQYGDWLAHAVRGDLGTSLFTSQAVAPAVLSHMVVTMSIVLPGLAIALILSVILGVWAASRSGAPDRIAQGISLVGHVVPALLTAIVLVVVFAVELKIFPATGYVQFGDSPVGWLRSTTLPVVVLVVAGMAAITAQVRGSMIDELGKDYVRTLRTAGLPSWSIVLKHALRNAGSPALTVTSLQFIQLFSHSVIIENVFALPGFGSFAFTSAQSIDVPVIMGVTIVSVVLVTVVNLIADIVNGYLNPKARLH